MRDAREVIPYGAVITSGLIGMEITRGALHLQFSSDAALYVAERTLAICSQGYIRGNVRARAHDRIIVSLFGIRAAYESSRVDRYWKFRSSLAFFHGDSFSAS